MELEKLTALQLADKIKNMRSVFWTASRMSFLK